MSLFGAVRLVCEGWRSPGDRPPDEPLPAIRSGAWAEWARAGTAGPVVAGELGTTCVAVNGRLGRVVAAHDGDRFVHVCEPA